MSREGSAQITTLLRAWSGGDQAALARLTPLVYEQLRRIARRQMRGERPGNSLQTTALVHEAWIRLVDAKTATFQDRAQFYSLSAKVMRQVLVDLARARHASKRGGSLERVDRPSSFNLDEMAAAEPSAELVALDDALNELARIDARKVEVIELRFFGGLSVEETAGVLNVSPQTVLRDWKLARAWLTRELTKGPSSGDTV
jgi:RNA polymerase sigma factor (TIGR02999 family)